MISRTGPENTAFIKEFQRRESKDSINFVKNLPEATKRELTGGHHKGSGGSGHGSKPSSKPKKRNLQGHISDPDLLNHLSMNLWRRVNAGYMVERRPCLSLSQASYTWDPKLLEKTSREHMHKRDMFSEYVEAAARFNIMIKSNTKARPPKYVPRALRPLTPGRKWYAPIVKLPPGYQEPGVAAAAGGAQPNSNSAPSALPPVPPARPINSDSMRENGSGEAQIGNGNGVQNGDGNGAQNGNRNGAQNGNGNGVQIGDRNGTQNGNRNGVQNGSGSGNGNGIGAQNGNEAQNGIGIGVPYATQPPPPGDFI